MLRNHVNIIYVTRRITLHRRVVVDELIDLIVSDREREHVFPRVNSLLATVGYAALHQLYERMAEQLGMYPQVLAIRQLHRYRIRQIPNAQLQRRTIRDLVRDIFSNRHRLRIRFLVGNLHQGHMILGHRMHLGNMHQRISKHARHVPIHFHHHAIAVPHRRGSIVIICPQAEMPRSVHRRNRHNEGIYMNAFGQRPRNVAEVDRNVVEVFAPLGNSQFHHLAVWIAHKKTSCVYFGQHFWPDQRFFAVFHRMLVIQIQILEFAGFNAVGHRARQSSGHPHG
jgi:hypothetical protein